MSTHLPLAVILLALLAAASAGPSLRCPQGLVGEGDARIDLLGRCGEPALKEQRVIERLQAVTTGNRRDDRRIQRTITVLVEDWTYDFGPNAFTHVVTLENGRVIAIERRSYGYRREPATSLVVPSRARCEHLAGVGEGDGKLDVLARCGEPAFVDAWDEWQEVVVTRGDSAVAERVTVTIEIWTYDLGRNRLVRFVRFENGRVVRVTTGGYGYAE